MKQPICRNIFISKIKRLLARVENMDCNRLTKEIHTGERYDIGDHTYGAPKITGGMGRVIIGKYCSISSDVTIIMDEHRPEWITTYPFKEMMSESWPEASDLPSVAMCKGDVAIGNDVLIGYGATILAGVAIGDGAIIAAKSVVTKNVEPYSVVAGSPAKEINKRFSQDAITKLMNLKWWNWPEERIRKNMALLCGGIENLEDIV